MSAVLTTPAGVSGAPVSPSSAAVESARVGVEPASAGASKTPDAAPLSPAERLTQSRSRLRTAMMNIAHPPPRKSLFGDLRAGELGQHWLGKIRALPGATVLGDSLQNWWRQHPLHTAGVMAEEASRKVVLPLARRNPLGFAAGSVVVGALFWLSRPWRWLLKPAILAGLLPQLALQVIRRVPMESWMHVLTRVVRASASRPSANTSKAPRPEPRH